jgi:hypothetical protein
MNSKQEVNADIKASCCTLGYDFDSVIDKQRNIYQNYMNSCFNSICDLDPMDSKQDANDEQNASGTNAGYDFASISNRRRHQYENHDIAFDSYKMPDDEPHQDVTLDSGEGDKETSQGMENEETNANHNFDSAVMMWLNESFCSKCMRPGTHCTEGLLINDDEEFIQFFKDHSTLMKRLLASYVVGKPSFNTLNDLKTFMDKRHGYHLNSFNSSCIKDHFFRTFKREHFYIV